MTSGDWQGLYSYSRPNRRPVSFAATFAESGSWLTGATQETGEIGEARGKTITATLQGRRSGASVTFLKTYDAAHRGYDAVAYEGEVSADGAEIAGRWVIAGNGSGTFLMIRRPGITEAVTKKVAERVRR